ncbi:MAG: hypothetical protein K6253_01110 [Candidatus Liberibacter asiaticus]|nr:hypothetical protein [Candidatus Karelsulcia muelleri]MCG7218400.1 hypothetical protein [Candidatus Liberibacter asiaticus]
MHKLLQKLQKRRRRRRRRRRNIILATRIIPSEKFVLLGPEHSLQSL